MIDLTSVSTEDLIIMSDIAYQQSIADCADYQAQQEHMEYEEELRRRMYEEE